jgi:hypothetical protein
MSFSNRPFRRPSPPRVTASVLAVGRRVYVASSGGAPALVPLTDDDGKSSVASLADGTEVEIRAWRPLGSSGTRYCVRSTADGVEGWLQVCNLRGSRIPVAPPPAAPPAAYPAPLPPRESMDSGRQFGQRNTYAPASPPAVGTAPATHAAPLPARVSEDSGRRFGQRSNY